jgi:hypothetical protein
LADSNALYFGGSMGSLRSACARPEGCPNACGISRTSGHHLFLKAWLNAAAFYFLQIFCWWI